MLTPLTLFSSDSFGDVPILSSHLKCVSGLVAFQVSVVKMHHHLCMLMLRIKSLLIIRGQNHHDSWLKVNTKSKLVCTYCILYTDFTELSRKKVVGKGFSVDSRAFTILHFMIPTCPTSNHY